MSPNAPVRVGFVGVGGMGQCAHLRNYASLPGCRVVALAEIRRETGERVAAKYGVPAVYDDFRAMLEREPLDAVVCAQPFQRHAVLLPELLSFGRPLFIEKPLTGSLEAGVKLLEIIRASGTWVMVGYHKRSDPASVCAVGQVRAFQKSGELGALKYVRVVMPAGDWIAGGFWDLVDEGDAPEALETERPPSDLDAGGYAQYIDFVNYYIHQVNLLRHFFGESYEVTHADPSGVILVARSESGVPGVIEMSPFTTTVDWQESVLAAFEHGYVKLELPAPMAFNRSGRVEILRDPGNGATPVVSSPQLPWEHAMRCQARNFLAAVRGEQPPMCDAAEALEDLRVARDYLMRWKGV